MCLSVGVYRILSIFYEYGYTVGEGEGDSYGCTVREKVVWSLAGSQSVNFHKPYCCS